MHVVKTRIFIILGFLFLGGIIWFKPLPKTQMLQIDITDREKGICASMYAEGFSWGLGQARIDVATMRMTGHSESEIKDFLYEMATKENK